ncbi:MAG: outer membrane protein [Gemmatimonas sp.]
MNRITRLVGVAALAAALPSVTSAQATSSKPISVGVTAGASLPIGDFGDAYETGFTVGGHVLLAPASLSMLAFRGDVTYDRWSAKGIAGQVVDANNSTLGVMGNVILRSGSAMSIKPYAIGGLGLLSSKYSGKIGNIEASLDRENNFGVQAGGGLEFALSGFTTFVEAKFVNAFAKDGNGERRNANWIPVTFGIRF